MTEVKAVADRRLASATRYNFICADCGKECWGRSYNVGFERKREICGYCWAEPRSILRRDSEW